MKELEALLESIGPADKTWEEKAWDRLHSQIRPPDSLGELEKIAARLAAMKQSLYVDLSRKMLFVMAGDHGVAAEGVSAYPQEVTPQMVYSFTQGWASINILAKHAGSDVCVADLGVAVDMPAEWGFISAKIGRGTASITKGPAMTREDAIKGIKTGADLVRKSCLEGYQLIGTGDMGIGNTTPSAAIICALSGKSAASVTGRGTGIGDDALARKVAAIETALKVNKPNPQDPVDVLSKVGGYEIAGLAGAILGAASTRTPVICDGLIATAGALIACRLSPASADYLFLSHQSVEPGHIAMFEMIGMRPILNLGMRLGEGTGAALVMNIIEAAAKIMAECKTFAEAGVSDKEH
ncbi:MAG: nicotinate-nucleotide--dimethylbenzimidazole phosphoribosyltransferase [Syntrophobacteraceae bacterium]|jgi:nicotinate-nucleotide--dimethylbenzimidazole phosphoribosyltransferase